jgi:DNA-binding HxlR family transcriptional regulator
VPSLPVSRGGWATAPDAMWESAAAVISVLGVKWALRVLRALGERPLRHNELARAVTGIHPVVLSSTLRRMQDAGLVERQVDPGPPAGVSYLLTDLAWTVFPLIAALARWADTHSAELNRHPAWKDGGTGAPEARASPE